MGASQFVGRVGGLAVALGVGVLFAGHGVATADSPASDSGASSASQDSGGASARGPRVSASRSSVASSASRSPRATDAAPSPESAQSVAPAISTVSSGPSNGGSNSPVVPLDPASVALGLAELARRPQGAASAVVANSSASATAQQTYTNNGVTVAPTVTIANGIIQGSLNATSARGATLTYTVADSSAGAKLALGTGPGTPTAQDFTALPYATWLDAATPSTVPSGTQSVNVRVSEVTPVDSFLTGIPLVGAVAGQVISLLQQLPLISTLLAPIIGGSVLASVSIDVGTLAAGKPVAYTYDVTSFDDTPISTNWFPSVAVANAAVGAVTAPTALSGPGLGSPGQTNPYAEWGITNQTLGVGTMRNAVLSGTSNIGYNVVTWDPRGEFASGGILQLDNPFYEGRDVSALVDFITASTPTSFDIGPAGIGAAVGMVGGSYGGGIQLSVAGTDPRINAIVPDIAWNSLNSSLYPDTVFKTAYASLLYLSLLTTGARVNNQIPIAILTGDLFGFVSQTAQAILGSSGPTSLLNQLIAPTLLTQGTVDVLFPLQQSLDNAQTILGNPFGVTTKVEWFCGGHGICADFTSDSPAGVAQAALLKNSGLAWLDQYVNPAQTANAANLIPNFQWVDQTGSISNSSLLPYETGFNNLAALTATNAGGLLGILPYAIGGSGPGAGSLPYSAGNGSPAGIGISVPVTVPTGTQVVGVPTVSFTYSGLGTARAVYGQVIDNSTGRVLGNVVTPIPLTLDGQQHQVSVPLGDIAYTYGGTTNPGQLTVQITGSATAFWNSSWGAVNISNLSVSLPNRTA